MLTACITNRFCSRGFHPHLFPKIQIWSGNWDKWRFLCWPNKFLVRDICPKNMTYHFESSHFLPSKLHCSKGKDSTNSEPICEMIQTSYLLCGTLSVSISPRQKVFWKFPSRKAWRCIGSKTNTRFLGHLSPENAIKISAQPPSSAESRSTKALAARTEKLRWSK